MHISDLLRKKKQQKAPHSVVGAERKVQMRMVLQTTSLCQMPTQPFIVSGNPLPNSCEGVELLKHFPTHSVCGPLERRIYVNCCIPWQEPPHTRAHVGRLSSWDIKRTEHRSSLVVCVLVLYQILAF